MTLKKIFPATRAPQIRHYLILGTAFGLVVTGFTMGLSPTTGQVQAQEIRVPTPAADGAQPRPLEPQALPAPQGSGPRDLAPRDLSPQSLAPRTLSPTAITAPTGRPSVAPTDPPETRQTNPVQSTSIQNATTPRLQPPLKFEVNNLGDIDPDAVGALTEENGGFATSMWQGTRRELVEGLLPKLPVSTSSRAMRQLMRRLMLSAATVPQGNKKQSLVSLRIDRLAAMGDVAGVNALLRASPSRSVDPVLLRSETEMLFLANDNGRACPLVASRIRDKTTTFWQKAFVFCQALAGQHEKAALGASLLEERDTNDPVFFGLIDKLSNGGSFRIETLKDPSPLHFAMVRAAKAQLPADIIASDNPNALRTIATSPNALPDLRLDAAERAEAMGALSTDVVRQLYGGITLTDNDGVGSTAGSASGERALARALLYRKALVETVPAAVAEILDQVLKSARRDGRYGLAARIYEKMLVELQPSQDLVWFAPEAVRALLAGGSPDAATNWFAILRASAGFNEESAEILDGILPLARLTGAEEAADWSPEEIGKWFDVQLKSKEGESADRDGAFTRAALLYNLLEALGDVVPDRHWAPLLEGPPQVAAVIPRPALWRGLGIAANNGRVGETVLLSLLTLGQAGPNQANPTVIRRVITALRAVGLEADARALAVEAAIAAGI